MEGSTEGVITSVYRNGETTEYTVFDGEKYHKVSSKKKIRGRYVRISGNNIEEVKKDVLNEIKKRFFRKIKFSTELPKEIAFLRAEFEKLWKEIAFVKITGEKPLIYFDPDADGIISFLLISETIRTNYRPLNPWNLENGSNLGPDLRAPFYILLDLGSATDMHPGVRFLSALKPVFIVDHHYSPISPPISTIINPALKNSSLSSYTTAILVSYLVRNWIERDEWIRVAAAGDRSNIVKWDKKDRKKALALEISVDVFGNNPSVWKQVLDGDIWEPLWQLFLSRMEKIDELANKEELELGGKRVLIVSYPYPGFYYPHRGKVASWYQEEEGYDVVIVREAPKEHLYTVSMRSKTDLFPLLDSVRKMDLAEGWGHPNAVTMKTNDPDSLLEYIKRWLEHEGGEEGNKGNFP